MKKIKTQTMKKLRKAVYAMIILEYISWIGRNICKGRNVCSTELYNGFFIAMGVFVVSGLILLLMTINDKK